MATNPLKLKTLAWALALVLAAEALAWWSLSQTALAPLAVLGMVRLLQIVGILWIVVALEGGLTIIGWAPLSWGSGFKKGAIWSLGFAGAAILGMATIYLAGHNPLRLLRTPLPSGATHLTLFFIVGGFIAPLAEEICFRGLLYTFFRRWGILLALVASTTIFVILHSVHGIPVTQIVGGLVFAIAYETSGNLMVPITIHVLGNLAIFTLSVLPLAG